MAPMDEPVPSNTIPELSSMSQVLAPNSVDAEMQSVSLRTPHSPTAGAGWSKQAQVDENSDPNQAAAWSLATTGHSASNVEMQPLQKRQSASLEDINCRRREVCINSAACWLDTASCSQQLGTKAVHGAMPSSNLRRSLHGIGCFPIDYIRGFRHHCGKV